MLYETELTKLLRDYFFSFVKKIHLAIDYCEEKCYYKISRWHIGGMLMTGTDRYRDPIHGFIEVRAGENRIINTRAFQRLRNIKQLALTCYIYHGAEHTRFGHSLGVMHLVTKTFNSAIRGYEEFFLNQNGHGMNKY